MYGATPARRGVTPALVPVKVSSGRAGSVPPPPPPPLPPPPPAVPLPSPGDSCGCVGGGVAVVVVAVAVVVEGGGVTGTSCGVVCPVVGARYTRLTVSDGLLLE